MRTGPGIELAIARVISGKTVKDLVRETGINKFDISRIMNDRLNPTESEVERLRRATGWTPLISSFVQALHEGRTMLPECNGNEYDLTA